jgi:hypothetical protein
MPVKAARPGRRRALALLALIAAGLLVLGFRRAGVRALGLCCRAERVSYEHPELPKVGLAGECMAVAGQHLSCAAYRRHAKPHLLLVRLADGSASLVLPMRELGLARDPKTSVLMFVSGNRRGVAPVTFDGGFVNLHLTADQVGQAALHGISINGVSVPAAMTELAAAAEGFMNK